MPIKERGYEHWQGELRETRFPWWPITRMGIVLAFRRKFFKFFFSMTLLPAIVWLVGIYISERLEDFRFLVRGEGSDFLQVNPAYFRAYFTNDFLLFMVVLILVFCGSGLISDDLRHNALQLYFARPLKRRDYLFGKAGVICFFLFMVTLVPGLTFLVMKLLFAGNFHFLSSYPWLPFSVILYTLMLTVFFTLYALFLSSVSRNRRYGAVWIFGIYLFSDIFYGIFRGIFRSEIFSLLSIKANLQQVGAVLFKQRPPLPVPWVYSLAVITGWIILSAILFNRKIRGVEIVR